ncbi:MAG: HEAT repeat domain-containing protein [Deltaproteobacteria bacterium]|nr:HEAT repeat domain-containing protein [Deltaproteobacteria bacterium]
MYNASGQPIDSEPLSPDAVRARTRVLGLSGYRDYTQWFRASFAGTLCSIALITLFGFILVSRHAQHLSLQMQFFISSGMEPLVSPDDPFLIKISHRLSSALFFGCTLGVLNALAAMVLSLFPWLKGRYSWSDIAVFLALGALCTWLGYSAEAPVLSIVFGCLSPVVFFVPWTLIIRRSRPREIRFRRWFVLAAAASAPFLFMLVLGNTSFGIIRDSMLTLPVMRNISDFYYDHTLLAAHVIKPVSALEQKVVAVSDEIRAIGPMPHGSIWVRTPDPCGLAFRDLAVSREKLSCASIVLRDDRPANVSNRLMKEITPGFDKNRMLRHSIGIFFYRGPIALIPVLFMLWFALFLANLSLRSKIAAGVLFALYLSLFFPAWKSVYQRHMLILHPERIAEHILSEHEDKRYIALLTFPDEFTSGELNRFARDISPRIRLRSIYEAGRRKDTRSLDVVEEALSDPQLNVRTQACRALSDLPSENTGDLLEQAFLHDPSWYVRGYAYRALGKVRPVAKVVRAAGSGGLL